MQRTNISRGSKHHKPTKGQKRFMKQKYRALKRKESMDKAKAGIPDYLRKKAAAMYNWFRKMKYLEGKYTPHQGHQEKARRVRQMQEHKCINPECWTYRY